MVIELNTKQYIEEILQVDYYTELFRLAESIINYQKEGMNAQCYMEKLPDAIHLFESNAITPSHFRLAENIYQYIAFSIFIIFETDSACIFVKENNFFGMIIIGFQISVL